MCPENTSEMWKSGIGFRNLFIVSLRSISHGQAKDAERYDPRYRSLVTVHCNNISRACPFNRRNAPSVFSVGEIMYGD